MEKLIIRVKETRLRLGLTDEQVAEGAGISKAQVNRIENGLSDPTMQTLFRISQAMNVPFEELYKKIDEE